MANLAVVLERLTNLLRAEQREAGAAAGLQPVHLASLAYLSRANRYSDTPAAVTDYLGATKGTVSQSLRLLERKGFIARRPDAEDKRVAHLELTASGKRALAAAWPSSRLDEALASLAPKRQERLEEDLLELLTALQRTQGGRSFGVCRTCRLFERTAEGFRCGLTGEPLAPPETEKRCREHEAAA